MTRLLVDPFQLPFMQRALVEVLLLGLLAGVVGVYVVLRRLAFVGDAVSHTVFPGVVVAALLGQSLALGALVAGALTAVLLTVLSAHRRGGGGAGPPPLPPRLFSGGGGFLGPGGRAPPRPPPVPFGG